MKKNKDAVSDLDVPSSRFLQGREVGLSAAADLIQESLMRQPPKSQTEFFY
ncbi:hypothetical protein [Algoriphagus formosus]|uniref:hypothetical protein n=1 Tax=Algoriphagus formosus TaxID=2007308 RepID=UPI003F71A936